MTDAQSFLDRWSKVWNGRDSDPQLYMELAPARGCPLINPINPTTREGLPQFIEAVLAVEPDIHVVLCRRCPSSFAVDAIDSPGRTR